MAILQALESAGVATWVDGGWGVDALLGQATRAHEDLDLVISLEVAREAEHALASLGFATLADELPTRLAMRDADDRAVDLHAVTFDGAGDGWQQLPGGTQFAYRAEGLKAEGLIGGVKVRCLSPELQVACHLGYEPDETDRADMRTLAARFGLRLPPPYA